MKPITAVWPGRPAPLVRTGTAKASTSRCSPSTPRAVELCLFDASGRRELQRIALAERTDQVWHCYLPEARPGHALRLSRARPVPARGGPSLQPAQAAARSVRAQHRRHAQLERRAVRLHASATSAATSRSTAATAPARCRSARSSTPAFTWGDDRRPDIPWHDMVIYELHVRGFTMQHPGRAAAAARHLRRARDRARDRPPEAPRRDHRRAAAGARVRRRPPPRRARGCATTGATTRSASSRPRARYSASGKVDEFKTMVKTLHSAGIEVILDVVYNHTAEGNELGPTLCFRGIDNASYYRLKPDEPRYYMDYTGCGNTLNMQHPARAAAAHGFAALLGHRDARRRLPLRPRLRARARAARGRPARRVLRHPAAGPGAVAASS